MNGEKLGKFSSAEDDHKLKYMEKSFLTHPVGYKGASGFRLRLSVCTGVF